jgi:diketogulonate reductase-like aldo/keto reductase
MLQIADGEGCSTNQLLYNVTRRGPEFDLIPWLSQHRMPLTAYSPVEQGQLPRFGVLSRIAAKHGASRFRIALAWLLQQERVIAIPKAGTPDHVRGNHRALELRLDPEHLQAIDAALPPPTRKRPLEMI